MLNLSCVERYFGGRSIQTSVYTQKQNREGISPKSDTYLLTAVKFTLPTSAKLVGLKILLQESQVCPPRFVLRDRNPDWLQSRRKCLLTMFSSSPCLPDGHSFHFPGRLLPFTQLFPTAAEIKTLGLISSTQSFHPEVNVMRSVSINDRIKFRLRYRWLGLERPF